MKTFYKFREVVPFKECMSKIRIQFYSNSIVLFQVEYETNWMIFILVLFEIIWSHLKAKCSGFEVFDACPLLFSTKTIITFQLLCYVWEIIYLSFSLLLQYRCISRATFRKLYIKSKLWNLSNYSSSQNLSLLLQTTLVC